MSILPPTYKARKLPSRQSDPSKRCDITPTLHPSRHMYCYITLEYLCCSLWPRGLYLARMRNHHRHGMCKNETYVLFNATCLAHIHVDGILLIANAAGSVFHTRFLMFLLPSDHLRVHYAVPVAACRIFYVVRWHHVALSTSRTA